MLIASPTGTGKTFAAFLSVLDARRAVWVEEQQALIVADLRKMVRTWSRNFGLALSPLSGRVVLMPSVYPEPSLVSNRNRRISVSYTIC